MTWPEQEERMNMFIDGELSMKEQVELFKHLSGCTVCQEFMNVMVRMRESERKEAIPFPSTLDEEILSKIVSRMPLRTEHRASPERSREGFALWKIDLSLPWAAAAAVVLVLAGIFLGPLLAPAPSLHQALPVSMLPQGQQPAAVIVVYSLPPYDAVVVPRG